MRTEAENHVQNHVHSAVFAWINDSLMLFIFVLIDSTQISIVFRMLMLKLCV